MTETPKTSALPLVRSNLVWDLIVHDDAPTMLRLLEMTPPGPDGMGFASADSRARLKRTDVLDPSIGVLASEISSIFIRAILGEAVKEADPEVVEELKRVYEGFLGTGLKVAIANLMAAGILTLNAGVVR